MRNQIYLLKQVDSNEITKTINRLYEDGILQLRTSFFSGLQEQATQEEELKKLNALVIYIIIKNKNILQSKKSKTIIGSAIYLACKKLGIKVTYRGLYKLGITEYALRMTVKSLSF